MKDPKFLHASHKTVEIKVWEHTKLTEDCIKHLQIHSKPEIYWVTCTIQENKTLETEEMKNKF